MKISMKAALKPDLDFCSIATAMIAADGARAAKAREALIRAGSTALFPIRATTQRAA